MEACIEALYTIDGESDKRKTLEMIRVLKGAISVSKSRTGEVIYRYNRHEKKALGRTLAKFDKDTARSRVNIDSQKRNVLRKWNLVFGRQRKFTESLRGFDNMLNEAISTRQQQQPVRGKWGGKSEEGDETDGELEEKVEEEEKKEEKAVDDVPSKMPLIHDPRARRLGGGRPAPQGIVATPAMVGVLPKLTSGGALHNARVDAEEEERRRKEKLAEEERLRKAREMPRFDKELMESYLTEQRTLHEDLLTRNTLIKIKSSLDKDHVFFKHLLKSKLPDNAPSLLHSIQRERSASAMTWAGPTARSRSRMSGLPQKSRLRSSKSTKSCLSARLGEEEDLEVEEVGLKMEKTVLTARDPPPPPSSVRRLDRSKTVHFS